jgi:hypothetical protein
MPSACDAKDRGDVHRETTANRENVTYKRQTPVGFLLVTRVMGR